MTVHAAKGLEFPITVVSGLTTEMQRQHARCRSSGRTAAWTLAERDNELFEAFKPLDEQMGDAERRRLLYVACTRAVDHLVVSLHRKPRERRAGHGPLDERHACWRKPAPLGHGAARARRASGPLGRAPPTRWSCRGRTPRRGTPSARGR